MQNFGIYILSFCIRVILIFLGLGDILKQRVEISTPLTSVERYKEGLQFLELNKNPYTGSIFHGSPILLKYIYAPLYQKWDPNIQNLGSNWDQAETSSQDLGAISKVLGLFGQNINANACSILTYIQSLGIATQMTGSDNQKLRVNNQRWDDLYSALFFALVDVVGAYMFERLYRMLILRSSRLQSQGQMVQENENAQKVYLFNPLIIATSIACSVQSLDNMFIVGALYFSVASQPILSGLFLALSTHLNMQSILLMAPLIILNFRGPEDLSDQLTPIKNQDYSIEVCYQKETTADSYDIQHKKYQTLGPDSIQQIQDIDKQKDDTYQHNPKSQQTQQPDSQLNQETQVLQNKDETQIGSNEIEGTGGSVNWPNGIAKCAKISASFIVSLVCLSLYSEYLVRTFDHGKSSKFLDESNQQFLKRNDAQSFLRETYLFTLQAEDLFPNLGLYWYFFAEVFRDLAPFFLVAFNSMQLIIAFPLLFSTLETPLFSFYLFLPCIMFYKPYPSLGDYGLLLSLTLLVFQPHLLLLPNGYFLGASFLALLSLLPPLYYQWIYTHSANSNFYYAITLGLNFWLITFLFSVVKSEYSWNRLRKGQPITRGFDPKSLETDTH